MIFGLNKPNNKTKINMKKLFIITALSTLAFGNVFAQKGKVNTAEFNLSNGDIVKAKENIDVAFSDNSMQEWPKAWFVKGDVYKGIYEQKDAFQNLFATTPDALQLAKEAYLNAYNLEEKPRKKASVKDGLQSVGAFFYNEGIASYGKNDWEHAYANFSEALNISQFLFDKDLVATEDTNAYYVVVLSAFNSRKLDEAQVAAEKLVSMDTDRAEIYSVLISIYQEKKQDDLFASTIDKARKLFPNDADILFHEINLYLKNNEIDKLENKLLQAIKIDPTNPSLYQAMASVYDKKGDRENTMKMYDKAIEVDSDFIDAYINKAGIYNTDANKIIEKMNDEMDHKKYDQLKIERDVIFKEKMMPLLKKAHSINPNNENVKTVLKEIYARLEMFDEMKKLD